MGLVAGITPGIASGIASGVIQPGSSKAILLAQYIYGNPAQNLPTTSRATVSPMYPDASGDLVQYAANNVALVGGDSVACWPGLRNLLTRSEDFSHSDWLKGGSTTVTANAATSPDGTDTADRIELPAGYGTYTRQAVSMSSGQAYTFSVYVKSNTGGNQNFVLDVQNVSFANGDPTAHVATTSWQRFDTVYTPGTTGTWYPIIDDNAGAGADLLIWGAQLTQSSYLLPYVPTAGSSVAVDASEPVVPWPSGLVNDFVVVFRVKPSVDLDDLTYPRIIDASQDNNNGLRVLYDNNSFQATKYISGSGSTASISQSITANTEYEIRVRVSSVSGIDVWCDDTKGSGNSNTTSLSSSGDIYLGTNLAGNRQMLGNLRDLRIIKVAPNITDIEVLAL